MIGTLIGIDLKRKMRGPAWWILFGLWFFAICGISALFIYAIMHQVDVDGTRQMSIGGFQTILMLQAMALLVVVPAFSASAINSDRESGVLAQVQVTLATSRQIVVAKVVAAWVLALMFILPAVPGMLWFVVSGNIPVIYTLLAFALLVIEVLLISAICVGLSGLVRKPVFSILYAYLMIAVLSVGIPLGGVVYANVTSHRGPITTSWIDEDSATCAGSEHGFGRIYDTQYVWWTAMTNPNIAIADALPKIKDGQLHQAKELFRSFQQDTAARADRCNYKATNIPGWPIGLGVYALLGIGLTEMAIARSKTPIKRLPRGGRIA